MDGEDIGLDFDCDITSKKSDDEVWHSESEHSTSQSGLEATDDPSDSEKDAEKQKASTPLQKLDERLDKKPASSSEDSPVWPRPKKRRRLSVSRSGSTKQVTNKETKPKKRQ